MCAVTVFIVITVVRLVCRLTATTEIYNMKNAMSSQWEQKLLSMQY